MPESAPSRLLLLDGHSLAYRAFFALPVENFSTTTGQHTNAVFGFTSMLINVLRDEQPTHLGVAFDVSRQTFRAEEYADYKANRSASPSEFKGQLSLIEEVLDALHIPYLKKDGFEADDIIATLVTQALAEGSGIDEVLILTGDRDSLQLVTERSTVLYPMRGVSDLARMTPQAVETKYGVPPERYPELAALVGETSDNLPGIPGVGPGYAAKWINTYDGLDNVITHADKITGKKGEALRAHLGDVIRNRRLNALVTDLELELGPGDLEKRPWDRQQVHNLFDSLEFQVLRNRLFESLTSEEVVEEGGFELDGATLGEGEVRAWLAALTPGTVGVVVRGEWGAGTGRVDGLALATAAGQAAYVDTAVLSPDDDAALGEWLADAARPKVLHDAKGPLLALAAQGWSPAGLQSDTALAAYLVRPDQRSYDLADLTLRYLKRELKQESGDDRARSALRRRRRGRDHRDAARPRGARPRRGARRGRRRARRRAAAGRGRAAADHGAPDDGADRHRRRRRPPRRARVPLRGRGEAGRRPGLRGDRQGDQPRLAQAAADRALRRARDAQDQAHQDRLHHRRRRAGRPPRQDRAPVPAAPAAAPRRLPAAADHRRPAQDGRARRPHPHDLQPADRGHGPALEHRPQPAEHPGPHRGGAPHPRGLRRGSRLRVPAHRRLQPDRDADHGPPLRGRRC